MNHQYLLRVLGPSEFVEIDEASFLEVKRARDALVTMIGVEQKFDLLLENYADYERQLLELSLHQALRVDHEWASFQDDIAAVSRRFANLLSAARLYLDQVKHDLSTVFGSGSELAKAVKAKASEQYDSRLGYRVMETVRNVMQHESISVHGIRYPCESAAGHLRYRTLPTFDVSRLRDSQIKASVLRELEAKEETIELTPLIRDYIEGLGQVHEALRALAAPQVSSWDTVLVDTQARGAKPNGGDPKCAVLAQRRDTSNKVIETVQVFTDLTAYRQAFERRNRILAALTRRFVSSESGDI